MFIGGYIIGRGILGAKLSYGGGFNLSGEIDR